MSSFNNITKNKAQRRSEASRSLKPKVTMLTGLVAGGALLLLVSCGNPVVSGIAKTALRVAVASIGGDIIQAAAINHAPDYATQVERLLLGLVREVGGVKINTPQPLSDDDYEYEDEEDYDEDEEYYDEDEEDYDEDEEDYDEDEDSYDDDEDSYDDDEDSYDEDEDSYDEDEDSYDDDEDSYDDDEDSYDDDEDSYDDDDRTSRKRSSKSRSGGSDFNFDFSIYKKTENGSTEVINDGDILYDYGDPLRGDKLKAEFSVDCKCYVYIVGIDATGFVASIFPDLESNAVNPATPDRLYELPSGNTWWGLDQNKGIETIYLVISREPRDDVSEVLANLKAITPTARRDSSEPSRSVRSTMVAQMTRGLKKITLRSNAGANSVDRYSASLPNKKADVVLTRWFEHR